jgi:hypothetical protein
LFQKTRNCISSSSRPSNVDLSSALTTFVCGANTNHPRNCNTIWSQHERGRRNPKTMEIRIQKLLRRIFHFNFPLSHHSKSFRLISLCRLFYLLVSPGICDSISHHSDGMLSMSADGEIKREKKALSLPTRKEAFSASAQRFESFMPEHCCHLYWASALQTTLPYFFSLLLPHIQFSFLIEIYYQQPNRLTMHYSSFSSFFPHRPPPPTRTLIHSLSLSI